MRTIADKVVVITGASRGIGAAIAELFAKEHALLVLCGRNRTALTEVVKKCRLGKQEHLVVTADLTKAAGMKKIIDAAYKKFGRIDIFINNAGVGMMAPVTEMTEQQYEQVFDTNVKAIFHCFRELLPRMHKQGHGQIINISSMVAKSGAANMAVYAASKAALNILSESVAGEVRNDNIKIGVLAPASTDTGFGSGMTGVPRGTVSRAKKKLTAFEVAEAALFMAQQNENAWMSMADLRPLIVKPKN